MLASTIAKGLVEALLSWTGGLQRTDARAHNGCRMLSSQAEIARSMQDFEDDDEIPLISGSGEGLMDEAPGTSGHARRNEDIALDLMKFIAMTTGYGKTASSGGVGFSGGGAASKPEDYAAHLLELYGKCKAAVEKK